MDNIKDVLVHFGFEPDAKYIPWGNGHINDTFRVEDRFLLQRINTNVFKDYEGLMNNVHLVTTFLQKMLYKNGGNVLRETMGVLPSIDGKNYYVCPDGKVYRMYIFIQDSLSIDRVETKDDLYACGFGFGDFQKRLQIYIQNCPFALPTTTQSLTTCFLIIKPASPFA